MKKAIYTDIQNIVVYNTAFWFCWRILLKFSSALIFSDVVLIQWSTYSNPLLNQLDMSHSTICCRIINSSPHYHRIYVCYYWTGSLFGLFGAKPYLNQCWFVINHSPRYRLQSKSYRNRTIYIDKVALKVIVCNFSAILWRRDELIPNLLSSARKFHR